MVPGFISVNCPKPDSADDTPVKVLGEKVEITRTRREIWEETVRICETQFNLLLASGMDWRDAASILPTGTLTVNGRPVALVVGGEGLEPFPGFPNSQPDGYEAFARRMGVRPEPLDGIRPHLPRPDPSEDPLEARREELYAGPGPLDVELDQLKARREELRRTDRESFGPGARPLDPL